MEIIIASKKNILKVFALHYYLFIKVKKKFFIKNSINIFSNKKRALIIYNRKLNKAFVN